MLKVYANVIHPGKGLADALRPLCHEAVSTDGGDDSVTEKDGMVLLSFEGIYFRCHTLPYHEGLHRKDGRA